MFLERKRKDFEILIKDFLKIDQNEDLIKHYSEIGYGTHIRRVNISSCKKTNNKNYGIRIGNRFCNTYFAITIYPLNDSYAYNFYKNGKFLSTITEKDVGKKITVSLVNDLKKAIFKNYMRDIKTLQRRNEKINEFKQKGNI